MKTCKSDLICEHNIPDVLSLKKSMLAIFVNSIKGVNHKTLGIIVSQFIDELQMTKAS